MAHDQNRAKDAAGAHLRKPKRVNDMPIVRVLDEDINGAIRMLKKKMLRSKYFSILSMRKKFPNVTDRKRSVAASRMKRARKTANKTY